VLDGLNWTRFENSARARAILNSATPVLLPHFFTARNSVEALLLHL
jgi:hypothetical protein